MIAPSSLVRAALAHASAGALRPGGARLCAGRRSGSSGPRSSTAHEHWRRQAPGLPFVDPFAAHGFNPDRIRRDPDVVQGVVGLVSRVSGVASPQQLENAMEVMENQIRVQKMPMEVKRRNLGEPVPVQQMNLLSRLPPKLQKYYTGKVGREAFSVYAIPAQTVIFDLFTKELSATRDMIHLLYVGMLELGITCLVCPRGIVDALDESTGGNNSWAVYDELFSRPVSRVPEGTQLFHRANGSFKLGELPPRPIHHPKAKGKPMWRNQHDMQNALRRNKVEVTMSAEENSVLPADVLVNKKWKSKGGRTMDWRRRAYKAKEW
ncbi:hypothetical protein DIPPA_10216 [Diplonema papillatum]|nr:hypothetical protein DIPPA_10216 [Diplonema papillatum]